MNRESETEQHPGPITLAEAVQAICSNRAAERAAFLDRVWASTRHPEKVVDLEEVRQGRARAALFIQALEAINQRDKK